MTDPSRVFGQVADDYDRVRPAYPAALFDDVLAYSRPGPRAVEVGAGTGRATEQFAARGVPVVAVEPDDAMADVLARRVARFPDVHIVRSSFEDFRPAERFGLLFSAEAWHWTAPATRWSLAADALDGGATLALFWNTERIADPALRTSLLETVARHAPSVVVNDEPVAADQVRQRWPGDELSAAAEFEDLTSRHYQRRWTMPKADYVGLTSTRSQVRVLPQPVRDNLLAALSSLLDEEVPVVIHTTLVLARRR
ncbi:class I SAM-dependent methyltransferase [Actinoplanes sp. Pm04-4]|uniref:Class I SAM-dependent methyltransferase n=1 Tax=Paractinoplanes pyxinae TaxID=2997416 RepID=A0ABT4B9Z3_9ACTN|nr:class I SAM-dependent methyltransferase [Actinoplanes pyxinae]MCY1143331.1 class I SAM-dependent methyltransferase [Actinoplanes pyxinae]